MLQGVADVLDWFGLVVFATTGALVASRKQMDIVGFALLRLRPAWAAARCAT